MEIKWHDQSRGAVKNERWVSIPSGKAMEMLRRKHPDEFSDLVRELNLGREVRTDAYTLRDETVNKAQYMQDLDDDDFHTVTFFLGNARDLIADEMACTEHMSKLRELALRGTTLEAVGWPPPFEIKAGAICDAFLANGTVNPPLVEGPTMTATEVQMRMDEYTERWPRLKFD